MFLVRIQNSNLNHSIYLFHFKNVVLAQNPVFHPPGSDITCCYNHETVYNTFRGCQITDCAQWIAQQETGPHACPLFIINAVYCACNGTYLYNNCGECVDRSKCNETCKLQSKPKCNGPNEVFVDCLLPKEYNMCESLKSPFAKFIRSNINSTDCIQKVCNCDDGFFREANGVCVPECESDVCEEKECPGPYEELVNSECRCIRGYTRNECFQCDLPAKAAGSGSCKCTPPCSDPNAERRCFNPDCQRTCENFIAGMSDVCPTSSKLCSTGCDCAEYYYYNSTIGACVPSCEC